MSKRNTEEFGRISTAAFGFLKSHDLGRLNPLLKGGVAYFDEQGNIMDTQLEHPGSFPLQAYFNNLAATELKPIINPVSKQMMSITALYNLLLIYLYHHNRIAMADENKGKDIKEWNTNRFAATKDFQEVFFNPKITMSNMSSSDISTIAIAHIAGFDQQTKQPYTFSDLDIHQMDFFRDITGQVLNDNAKNYKNRQYVPSSLGKVAALFGQTKAAKAIKEKYDETAKQLTAKEVKDINEKGEVDIERVNYMKIRDNKMSSGDRFRINGNLQFFFKYSAIGIIFILYEVKNDDSDYIYLYLVYYNDGYQQEGPKMLYMDIANGTDFNINKGSIRRVFFDDRPIMNVKITSIYIDIFFTPSAEYLKKD